MIIDTKELFFERINQLYQRKVPFFFLTDYACRQMEVTPLSELSTSAINFQLPGYVHEASSGASSGSEAIYSSIPENKSISPTHRSLEWEKSPISYDTYLTAYNKVQRELQLGNSYLVNLTCSTPVKTNYTLKELYQLGAGKYKLWYRDQFVHFSPEPFIRIDGVTISSFPMKGTIDAMQADAADQLIQSAKETAEQFTIVDLIRNDLNQVALQVEVEDFRYVEKLHTNQKDLYTVSSKITGRLRPRFLDRPGDILAAMLPAGSVTGAPKAATCQIIADSETHQRNYYTGVWGCYNGVSLDSCVIIRYLEKSKEGFTFKSGGGITSMSDPKTEYQEMIDKVYVPLY